MVLMRYHKRRSQSQELLDHEHFLLRRCRARMAEPRYGDDPICYVTQKKRRGGRRDSFASDSESSVQVMIEPLQTMRKRFLVDQEQVLPLRRIIRVREESFQRVAVAKLQSYSQVARGFEVNELLAKVNDFLQGSTRIEEPPIFSLKCSIQEGDTVEEAEDDETLPLQRNWIVVSDRLFHLFNVSYCRE